MCTYRVKRCAEGVHARISVGEGVIGGQQCQAVAAAETDGASIAGGRIAIGIPSGQGEALGGADGGRGVSANCQGLRGSRVDRDGCITGDGTGDGIGSGDGLAAGGLKDKPGEGVHAGVGGREGIVGRQDSRQIGTGEVDRTQVTGQCVVIGVLGGEGDAEGRAGGGRRRSCDFQVRALADKDI